MAAVGVEPTLQGLQSRALPLLLDSRDAPTHTRGAATSVAYRSLQVKQLAVPIYGNSINKCYTHVVQSGVEESGLFHFQ